MRLEYTTSTKAWTENILNGLTYDTVIYRIFKLDHFNSLLDSKKLVLVNPDKWDDPFENFYLKANGYSGSDKVSLESLSKGQFGQCWTLNEDSDAMWRIYSPDKNGVRLKTTVGKLFQLVIRQQGIWADFSSYIGQVIYLTKEEIQVRHRQSFSETIAQNNGFANMLLCKRTAFQHEAEVRVLASVPSTHLNDYEDGLYKVDVDFDKLFDEICLDPRLTSLEFTSLREQLMLKTAVSIIQSDLYRFDFDAIEIDIYKDLEIVEE